MQMRMKKLEEIRLEVDSRRRTVQELTIKVRARRVSSACRQQGILPHWVSAYWALIEQSQSLLGRSDIPLHVC